MTAYNFTEKATVGNWSVSVDPSACYGYFEPVSGLEGGGLWFEGKTLTDYDGRFALPADVWKALEQLGYIIEENFK